jgi:hypothetical protein
MWLNSGHLALASEACIPAIVPPSLTAQKGRCRIALNDLVDLCRFGASCSVRWDES